jgi:nifR3 family TIM-barrel protein
MADFPNPLFHIRDIPMYGDMILSPMDGFSDQPFRSLARRLGSAASYTEFVNCIEVLNNPERVAPRLCYEEWERPVIFQIFDNDPARMLKAALQLQELEPDAIDVNMGCSDRSVAGRGAGAGLLRTPAVIAQIFQKLTAHLEVPVTGKIRLGWDEDSLNYLEVARIVEDNGGQLLAVHARTKVQGYGGRANWGAIAEVVKTLSIPVVGNGDVKQAADIARMKAETGCAAVMIARGAIGNPWLFAGLDREQVPPQQVREMMLEHLFAMIDFYGPEDGLIRFRKHAKQYISPYPLSRERRTQLLTSQTPGDFTALLDGILVDADKSEARSP